MRKRFIVIPVIILVVVGFIVTSLFLFTGDSLPTVQVTEVTVDHLTKEVAATGEISSRLESTIATEIGGRVTGVMVSEGDLVQSGDVIARLEDDTLQFREQNAVYALDAARQSVREQLLTLRSQFQDAVETLDRARDSFQRTTELRSIGSASEDALRGARLELGAAERNYNTLRQRLNFREGRPLEDTRDTPPPSDNIIIANAIEVKQALTNLETVRRDIQASVLKARIQGMVTELLVKQGDLVSPGSPLARVHDRSALEVTSYIDEVDLGYLEINQPVRIESDSFIGDFLTGKITTIAPIIHRRGDTRVCRIEVGFEDPQGIARIGASCTIYITVRDVPEARVIPIDSFFIDAGKRWVYVPVSTDEEGVFRVEKREVKIGIVGLDTAEVLEGLSLGERIISSGIRQLHEGSEVLLHDAGAMAAPGDEPL